VSDFQHQAEFRETVKKSNAMLEAMGLAETSAREAQCSNVDKISQFVPNPLNTARAGG